MAKAATIAALQALHATVTGVTSAPTAIGSYPIPLPDEALPCVLVLPGKTEGDKMPVTIYSAMVFVARVGAGNSAADLATALDLLDRFQTLYRTNRSANDYAILPSNPTRTGGLGSPDGLHKVLPWGGAEYVGFVYQVPVMEAP